jgi:PPE-repeat protein
MDFGMAPPEINSGRMYCGPGSASIVEAAADWERLAASLNDEAAQWRAVTSKLAVAATQAAARYISWLNDTAARAAHAAVHAAAAARAHQAAFAAMVPPEVINTNREKLVSLAATNCLGQTSATIADTEAEYERMWANDADAMYAYARASADASALTPFGSPPPTTDPAGLVRQGPGVSRPSWALESAPDVISSGQEVMAAIPKALQGLLSSPQISLDDYLSSVTSSLSQMSSLSERSDSAISNLNCLNKAAVLQKTAMLMFSSPNQGGVSGATRAAGFGRGRSIGTLSVPQRWVTETTIGADTVELGHGWVREPIHLVEATGSQLAGRADYPEKPGLNSGD